MSYEFYVINQRDSHMVVSKVRVGIMKLQDNYQPWKPLFIFIKYR